jgi:DNA-binding beta-propeller fold protein YncE
MTKRYVPTRRILIAVIILLVVVLCALVQLILSLLGTFQSPSNQSEAGLDSKVVIYGPGVGVNAMFKRPMGATFGKDGRIYVADAGNNRIVVFDSLGRYLFQFGGLGVAKPAPGVKASWRPGRFNYPTDIAADESGNVYVADFYNDQIQVFDADGRFLRVFPERDRPVGRGSSGRGGGIAVTSLTVKAGRVYATDRYQVVVFDTQGKLLQQFGKPGTGAGDLDHPNGIAVVANQTIVADSDHNRLLAFDAQGKRLWGLGKPSGSALGADSDFPLPRGVTVLEDGSILVADALASKLIRVSPVGRVTASYGVRGTAPAELNMPTDVAAGPNNTVVVADKGNDRVQVLGLSK